jgi:enterobactin synthetase component D
MSTSPLFPAFVAQHTLTFELDQSIDLEQTFPGIALPASLAGAVRKRKVEFLAGRFCARAALRACAPECAEAPISIGVNREPLWPSGVVGAITHTSGFVSVAVSRAVHTRGIGLDAERLMDEEQAVSLLEQIADRLEVSRIVASTGWNAATAVTAVFSAKETIFKTLYAQVNRYFDFRETWLDSFNLGEGSFRAHLVQGLTPNLPAGHALSGRFWLDSGLICTGMVLPA